MAVRTRTVSVEELDSSMVIDSYVGFGKLYTPTTEQSALWLIHNFKGSKVLVARGEKKGRLPVEKILAGDNLLKIYDIPKALVKLTKVTPPLAAELKSRGFRQFVVVEQVKTLSTAAVTKAKAVKQANHLVAQMEKATPIRSEAKQAVENMLDNARTGKISTADVMVYVDHICDGETTEALSAMTSLKQSDQTYAHCVDVAAIFQQCYREMLRLTGKKSIFESEKELMLAGFMHDFGKSKVPKDILDSTTRFDRDSREMQLLQSHPVFGAELLTHMGLPDHVVNLAHYHHVKMDPGMKSCYPQVSYDKVLFETKLLALVDIYQALVGKRSYKKSWTPPETMRYLGTLAGIEYEDSTYEMFVNVLGKYPKSSLVKLSDGQLGFVMNVPQNKKLLDRPQIAIVKNAAGEQLTHNDLLDLSVELDLSIDTELDAQDVFGEHALDVFSKLHIG